MSPFATLLAVVRGRSTATANAKLRAGDGLTLSGLKAEVVNAIADLKAYSDYMGFEWEGLRVLAEKEDEPREGQRPERCEFCKGLKDSPDEGAPSPKVAAVLPSPWFVCPKCNLWRIRS